MEEKIIEETVKAEAEVVKEAFKISPVAGIITAGVCGAITGGAVVYFGGKAIKKRIAKKAEAKAAEESNTEEPKEE